jgi:hypothetical protein
MTIEAVETTEKTTREKITKIKDIVAISRAACEAYVAKILRSNGQAPTRPYEE